MANLTYITIEDLLFQAVLIHESLAADDKGFAESRSLFWRIDITNSQVTVDRTILDVAKHRILLLLCIEALLDKREQSLIAIILVVHDENEAELWLLALLHL